MVWTKAVVRVLLHYLRCTMVENIPIACGKRPPTSELPPGHSARPVRATFPAFSANCSRSCASKNPLSENSTTCRATARRSLPAERSSQREQKWLSSTRRDPGRACQHESAHGSVNKCAACKVSMVWSQKRTRLRLEQTKNEEKRQSTHKLRQLSC